VNDYHPHELQRRALGGYVATGALVGVLLIGFFRIQVLLGEEHRLKAASNRVRTLPVPAPRGTVYDRNGRILADNVPGYQVTILPGPTREVRATLEAMSEHMDLSEERINRVIRTLEAYGREVVVDSDADFSEVAAIEERRVDFPGVYIEMRPRRRYAIGGAAGHITGYVGEITAEELGSESFPDSIYEAGMLVGKIGIEGQYVAGS
jgi:penicillin-binding protein 2